MDEQLFFCIFTVIIICTPSPEIYEESKIVDGKSAKEIWEKDNLKKDVAEKNGFTFYTIWEKDYKPGYKNYHNNDLILKIINENENSIFGF